MPFGEEGFGSGLAAVATEADRVAEEVVSIAVSTHLEDLREDMITNVLMKEFFGKHKVERTLMAMLAVATMRNLSVAIEGLADDLRAVVK
jgi:hypothetical protein